ncbi:uncharacterized protein LOC125039313 [Penaeus chinensis]|uniref:uncharacterized protein LOC125039313 n=1 Tax=Penaeus chinensis TaxID=139456 RepID=UPI001FB642CF|nr:uncharacterized protein LOC125039313 [Penaeus chinensis]
MALRQVVIDNQGLYDDEVTNCISENFYVDDCLKSVPTPKEAIDMIKDLKDLCKRGGFNLRGWISNSKDVMESIPVEDRIHQIDTLDLDTQNMPTERALGIVWSVTTDSFEFKINIKDKQENRRGILSMASSLYDPLGLVSPFTLPVKLILQSLSKKGLKWDEPIPDKESKEYRKLIKTIDSLENIKVPRCFRKVQAKNAKVQLHCFADASDSGYGVAIYARFQYSDQSIECNLVVGKSRVAPLKKITIPRMELTAATLAVKLANVVSKELGFYYENKFFWTDSTSVLKCIANSTTRYHTFVANRLTTIHEGSNVEDWHYIASDLNPADLASRGMHGNCDEEKISRWFQGPEFLSKPMSEWPESRNFKCTIIPDEMASKVVHATVIKEDSFMSSLTRGRLKNSAIPFERKHQIILPKQSDVSKLIVREAHVKKMADLPKERVTPEEPPFTKVGKDYFGPFEVKRGRTTVKRYGVIFTCLASRAVQQIQNINSKVINNHLINKGIEWEFNPPASSHFGGVWERMIRSVRKILYSLAKETFVTLNDESLVTLMHETEAILNNRPLTANPNVPSDLEALTPNHLLQLRPGNEMALGDFSEDCYSRKRWKQMQHLVDVFWKRWQREYRTQLQIRQKWCTTKRNVAIGDIVLIVTIMVM